jgi:hypothetical protein
MTFKDTQTINEIAVADLLAIHGGLSSGHEYPSFPPAPQVSTPIGGWPMPKSPLDTKKIIQ